MASIPLVEGRHALRGEKPNRSTLKQGCGGCRIRSEFKNRTESNEVHVREKCAPSPSPAPAQPRTWKGPAHNGGGAKLGKTSTAERLAAYKTCLDRCEAFDPQHMRGNRALRIDSKRCRANTCGA